jgi:hypothetical protein
MFGPQEIPGSGVGENCTAKISVRCSPYVIIIIGIMRWAGHVARMGDRRDAYMIMVGKPEGKRPFGITKYRWEVNVKVDFKEIGWEGLE